MTRTERELRGDMPRPAKIRDTLQRAVAQLREAILACTDGRDEVVVDAVWRSASEMEYLTFLLSLARGEKAYPWKARRVPRARTIVDSLRRAEEQLTEALANAGNPDVVYRLTWHARGHALGAQRQLDAALTRRLRRS
jgi:hypothetical protein